MTCLRTDGGKNRQVSLRKDIESEYIIRTNGRVGEAYSAQPIEEREIQESVKGVPTYLYAK